MAMNENETEYVLTDEDRQLLGNKVDELLRDFAKEKQIKNPDDWMRTVLKSSYTEASDKEISDTLHEFDEDIRSIDRARADLEATKRKGQSRGGWLSKRLKDITAPLPENERTEFIRTFENSYLENQGAAESPYDGMNSDDRLHEAGKLVDLHTLSGLANGTQGIIMNDEKGLYKDTPFCTTFDIDTEDGRNNSKKLLACSIKAASKAALKKDCPNTVASTTAYVAVDSLKSLKDCAEGKKSEDECIEEIRDGAFSVACHAASKWVGKGVKAIGKAIQTLPIAGSKVVGTVIEKAAPFVEKVVKHLPTIQKVAKVAVEKGKQVCKAIAEGAKKVASKVKEAGKKLLSFFGF